MIVDVHRDRAGDHVAVTDRLDLLETVLSDELVEVGEDPVEEADDLLRRQPLGGRREPGEIGKEDGDFLAAVGDDAALPFQPVRDRGGEHVEEESLGALALRRQVDMRSFARANEVLQEQEGGQGDCTDVEEEEDRDEPRRHVDVRKEAVGCRRDSEQNEETEEPRHGGLCPRERECAERSGDRPERDRSGHCEAAEAPLQEEGQEEHADELTAAKRDAASCPREEDEAGECDQLERERDRRGEPKPEQRVRDHPEAREDAHDQRREVDGLLIGALLGRVSPRDAELGDPVDLAPESHEHVRTVRTFAKRVFGAIPDA